MQGNNSTDDKVNIKVTYQKLFKTIYFEMYGKEPPKKINEKTYRIYSSIAMIIAIVLGTLIGVFWGGKWYTFIGVILVSSVLSIPLIRERIKMKKELKVHEEVMAALIEIQEEKK